MSIIFPNDTFVPAKQNPATMLIRLYGRRIKMHPSLILFQALIAIGHTNSDFQMKKYTFCRLFL